MENLALVTGRWGSETSRLSLPGPVGIVLETEADSGELRGRIGQVSVLAGSSTEEIRYRGLHLGINLSHKIWKSVWQ